MRCTISRRKAAADDGSCSVKRKRGRKILVSGGAGGLEYDLDGVRRTWLWENLSQGENLSRAPCFVGYCWTEDSAGTGIGPYMSEPVLRCCEPSRSCLHPRKYKTRDRANGKKHDPAVLHPWTSVE